MMRSANTRPSLFPRNAGRTKSRFISQVALSSGRSATQPATCPSISTSRRRPVRASILSGQAGQFLVETLETECAEAQRLGIFEEQFASLAIPAARIPRRGTRCRPDPVQPCSMRDSSFSRRRERSAHRHSAIHTQHLASYARCLVRSEDDGRHWQRPQRCRSRPSGIIFNAVCLSSSRKYLRSLPSQ